MANRISAAVLWDGVLSLAGDCTARAIARLPAVPALPEEELVLGGLGVVELGGISARIRANSGPLPIGADRKATRVASVLVSLKRPQRIRSLLFRVYSVAGHTPVLVYQELFTGAPAIAGLCALYQGLRDEASTRAAGPLTAACSPYRFRVWVSTAADTFAGVEPGAAPPGIGNDAVPAQGAYVDKLVRRGQHSAQTALAAWQDKVARVTVPSLGYDLCLAQSPQLSRAFFQTSHRIFHSWRETGDGTVLMPSADPVGGERRGGYPSIAAWLERLEARMGRPFDLRALKPVTRTICPLPACQERPAACEHTFDFELLRRGEVDPVPAERPCQLIARQASYDFVGKGGQAGAARLDPFMELFNHPTQGVLPQFETGFLFSVIDNNYAHNVTAALAHHAFRQSLGRRRMVINFDQHEDYGAGGMFASPDTIKCGTWGQFLVRDAVADGPIYLRRRMAEHYVAVGTKGLRLGDLEALVGGKLAGKNVADAESLQINSASVVCFPPKAVLDPAACGTPQGMVAALGARLGIDDEVGGWSNTDIYVTIDRDYFIGNGTGWQDGQHAMLAGRAYIAAALRRLVALGVRLVGADMCGLPDTDGFDGGFSLLGLMRDKPTPGYYLEQAALDVGFFHALVLELLGERAIGVRP